jgi:hypothetical protein
MRKMQVLKRLPEQICLHQNETRCAVIHDAVYKGAPTNTSVELTDGNGGGAAEGDFRSNIGLRRRRRRERPPSAAALTKRSGGGDVG